MQCKEILSARFIAKKHLFAVVSRSVPYFMIIKLKSRNYQLTINLEIQIRKLLAFDRINANEGTYIN